MPRQMSGRNNICHTDITDYNGLNRCMKKNKLIKSVKSVAISKHQRNESHGFIALTSVLIIESLILVIAVGVLTRSITGTNISLAEQQSHRALALANICAETALLKLESVLNYSGNETITVGSDSCNIATITGSGNSNRTVQASSTISGYVRKTQVQVSTISPIMQISSWTE